MDTQIVKIVKKLVSWQVGLQPGWLAEGLVNLVKMPSSTALNLLRIQWIETKVGKKFFGLLFDLLIKYIWYQPTDPFTTLELQYPSYDAPEPLKTYRSPDLEDLKLRKGLSGIVTRPEAIQSMQSFLSWWINSSRNINVICPDVKARISRYWSVIAWHCTISFHSHICFFSKCPTNPFTILELWNPSHDVPELHKIGRPTDFETLKLGKSSSGD